MNQYQLSPVDLPKNDTSCLCGENYSDGSCCGWKPKTKFCWHCAKQLRANFFREYKAEDGNIYIVHAACKEILENNLFDFTKAIDSAEYEADLI